MDPIAKALIKYDILPNGLVNSVPYYLWSSSEYMKIGIYKPKTNFPLVIKEFQMAAKQFTPIASPHRWIDSIIIDCFTATNMDDWKDKNISYMPTDIANKAIGTFASQRKSSTSDVYKIIVPLKDKLLIPYMFQGHCALFLVNVKEGTTTLLDPYEAAFDKARVHQAFHTCIGNCKVPCALSGLKHTIWQEKNITERPYQAASDTSNCAIYVMYYIYCFANKIPFELAFDPEQYRAKVAETLIQKSDDITNKCMCCFSY